MRENRLYGSEGGESGKPDFPTPMPNASSSLRSSGYPIAAVATHCVPASGYLPDGLRASRKPLLFAR